MSHKSRLWRTHTHSSAWLVLLLLGTNLITIFHCSLCLFCLYAEQGGAVAVTSVTFVAALLLRRLSWLILPLGVTWWKPFLGTPGAETTDIHRNSRWKFQRSGMILKQIRGAFKVHLWLQNGTLWFWWAVPTTKLGIKERKAPSFRCPVHGALLWNEIGENRSGPWNEIGRNRWK